jgi:hypothetical protein
MWIRLTPTYEVEEGAHIQLKLAERDYYHRHHGMSLHITEYTTHNACHLYSDVTTHRVCYTQRMSRENKEHFIFKEHDKEHQALLL